MKIAILTQPLDTNYGGILQCYALQTVLERMGYEVQVLTKLRYGSSYYVIYPLAVCKRMVKRYILGKDVAILKAPHEIRRKNLDKFIQQYIHQYKRRIFTEKIAYQFDAVVVGSDQVWRPAYSKPIEEAFLSFLGDANIKRISYAASFGLDNCSEYSREQLENCSCLLKKFDAVSVREASGVELCRKYFGVDAVHVLDPTLLLSVEDYKILIDKGDTKSVQDNMLVYILDKTEEKMDLVNRIASEKSLIPFWFDSPSEQNEHLPLDKQVKMSVEQWLRAFSDASFIVTDSFHGCVFSILFNKQFVAVGNIERGLSRFSSLLNSFSISERLVTSIRDYECRKDTLDEGIDFEAVDRILDELRAKSKLFIEKSIM